MSYSTDDLLQNLIFGDSSDIRTDTPSGKRTSKIAEDLPSNGNKSSKSEGRTPYGEKNEMEGRKDKKKRTDDDVLLEKMQEQYRSNFSIITFGFHSMTSLVKITNKYWSDKEKQKKDIMDGKCTTPLGCVTTDIQLPEPTEIPFDLKWDPQKEKDIMFLIAKTVQPSMRTAPHRPDMPSVVPAEQNVIFRPPE